MWRHSFSEMGHTTQKKKSFLVAVWKEQEVSSYYLELAGKERKLAPSFLPVNSFVPRVSISDGTTSLGIFLGNVNTHNKNYCTIQDKTPEAHVWHSSLGKNTEPSQYCYSLVILSSNRFYSS